MRRTPRIWLAGLVCGTLATGALAQEAESETDTGADSTSGQSQNDDLLAGPEVREDDSALPADFTGATQRAAAVISAEVWMRILRALELTEEQTLAIDEIEQEVRQALLEFRRSYGAELREFDRARREAAASGKRPTPEMQARYAEINKLAPSPIAAQERIWALLTEDQQADMSARLAEAQQRIIEERQRRAAAQQNADAPMTDMMEQRPPGDTAEETREVGDLDEAGQRRLRFLRQRQLDRPRGAPPMENERRFRFEDEDATSGERAG